VIIAHPREVVQRPREQGEAIEVVPQIFVVPTPYGPILSVGINAINLPADFLLS